MAITLLEAKQVGELYYMVSSLEILSTVIDSERIKSSRHSEYNPLTRRKQHSVSMSRQLNHHSFDSKRWYCGIQLNGDKLSNRYSIVPYSAFDIKSSGHGPLRVKSLIAYDDGTYMLTLVNHSSRFVNKETFDSVRDCIINADSDFNHKHRLTISTGKRAYRGKTALVRYLYDTPHGGVIVNTDCVSLSANPAFYEAEERIWCDTGTLDISGCISGVVLPKPLELMPEDSTVKQYFLQCCMNTLGDKFTTITLN